MFNRLLLIACVCIVVALVLYFFYWNRFIAFVIGQTIRLLFWNQEGSSIWIEIGSIHFSLLTGRILLKDVRYHSSNQTIKIVKGQIQWRYWIRRPTSEEEIHSIRGEHVKHTSRLWSCRIQLSFQGVEWFLYNRTAAYDNIIDQIEKASRPISRSSSHGGFFSRFSRQDTGSPFYPPSVVRASMGIPGPVKKAMAWFRHQLPTLDPKDLLPLGIDIQTGAIILGNHSTPNILVAEFQNALGTFGVVPSRSRYDLYKQVLNLKFQNALIRLVHNEDYVDPMTTLGALVHNRVKHHPTLRKPSFYQSYRTFFKLWRQIKLYGLVTDYFATRRTQRIDQTSGAPSTKKSKKMVDEDTPVGIDFSTFEYAVERKVLETPTLDLTYYVDVVGELPSQPVARYPDGIHDIGNGDTAPEWGVDLVMYGGFLRYGPWADRQRAELQRAFFPPTYLDSVVTPNLRPGEKRMWTALQVFVELRDETTLHIPFREASKDWQWDGSVNVPQRPRVREPASITVAVGDRSSINYILPMVVGPSGYESTLEVHLDTISITSSLNDIRLISAESCRVRGELPSPIRWDAERTWTIAAYLRQPILFLLRDHINIITDLGKDWVSGPPTEYQKFIPTIYDFNLEMHHFEINLYANDQNIVDKPLIKEENALITLMGPHLKSFTTIPSNTFRPQSTSVPFNITAPDLAVNFSLPRWNTHALHARKEGINLLKSSFFKLSGSYRYFAEVREEYVEQLKLQFDLNNSVFRAYGWSIRYFMVLRDNYFGSFTHFQTLYEYLDKRRRNAPVGDPIGLKYRPGKANMLQVEISLRVEGVRALLPIGLTGDIARHEAGPVLAAHGEDGNCLALKSPEIQLHLRIHDHYMEMSLNLDTITGVMQRDQAMLPSSSGSDTLLTEILMIDGVDITANRLFGPQPRTATYVCIWEIAVGNVKASMSAREITLLAAAGHSFRLNFVDLVNAPAAEFLPVDDPDVSFYKITVKTIEMNCKAGNAALLVQMQHGLKFDSNDLGAHQYRKVSSLKVPRISIKVLLTASVERNTWLEAAEAVFDVYLDIYASPVGHRAMTRKQLAFIEEQDRSTGRAMRMFNQLRQRARVNTASDRMLHKNGVYLPQPTLPNPANGLPAIVPPRQTNVHRHTPSWRFSALADLSDSEGEEGVSEADRDARLARTRTSTPVPERREDDVTMSSGDESDDADLTDGDSAGDDWSDIGGSSNEQATGSLMIFYSPMVRHYVPNWLEKPGSWEGKSFMVIREGATFMHHDSETESTGASNDAASFTLLDDIPKDENITTFRIKFLKNTTVVITPLLLPAAVYFEEEAKNIVIGPELCIDSLMVDCLARIFAKETSKSLVFELDLPCAKIQLIQHMAMSEEGNPNIAKAMQSTTIPSNLDITAVLNFGLHGLRLSGFVGKSSSFEASLKQATGMLDTSFDKRTLSTLPDSSTVELILSTSSVKLAQRSLGTTLGVISIKIGNRGPELVAAAAIALFSMGTLIQKLVHGLESHQINMKTTMIGNILKASEQQGPVIDSLSTIQPSYLVQTGSPHSLRTDATFKFLYHLRNSIRMGDPEDLLLYRSSNIIGLPDLVSLIESRLALLDQDAYSIAHLTSIDPHLFDHVERADRKPLKQGIRHLDFLSVQLTTATITVLDPAGRSSSQFVVDDLGLDLQSRKSDLIQFNFNNLSTASQTSLRSKSPKVVRKTVVIVSLRSAALVVSPNLMHFAQNILRVKRFFSSGLDDDTSPNKVLWGSTDKSSNFSSRISSLDVIAVVQRLRVQAAAENLVLVMGINGIRASSALLVARNQGVQSMSHAILFDEVYFQARSPANPAKESEQDILAAVAFTTGRISGVSRPEIGSKKNLKLVFTMASLRLHVPRSALRLYHFIGEWRADYLPGIEAAMKTLLSEYKARPTKPHSPAPSRLFGRSHMLQIHGQITHFEVSLQVMHGTWLSWEVNKTVAYFQSSTTVMAGGAHAFGLQVSSMVVSISSNPNARDVAPSSRIKLALPPLSLAGNSDGYQIHTLILFEFIELKVKPSHWDTLLSVQQKFGQDFNDLVALIQKTRQESSLPSTKPIANKGMAFQYEGHLKMQGFRIGLEGVSSTVLLECQNINGGVSNPNGWVWDVSLSDLALSLAPRVSGHRNATFNRNHRSAFVIIDFRFEGSNSNANSGKTLSLSVSKIHAVMQPSSIGEFGDFIDNLQAELLERQEQRALELAAFKEKTRRILETFDVNVGDVQLEQTPWINDLIVNISIRSIGAAFPLTHDDELVLPHVKGHESPPVPAFLFSIKSIEFATNRGETGQAIMQRLSFQFISRFRQSAPEDFAAERHHTRNCLLYPQMMAQLRSSSSGSDRSRKISIKADVSGFILDIDSTIPKYIFSLIDVYRQGKERVERLSANVPLTPFSSLPVVEDHKPPPVEKRYTAVPTSNVFINLVFHSGKVRLYSGAASKLFKASSSRFLELSDEQILSLGAEVFNLPVVSVWGEYRATPASQKLSKGPEQEPSILMFNSTVHSSNNVLRPTLLPFLTELVNRIENRMRKVSYRTSRRPSAIIPVSSNAPISRIDDGELEDSISSMQICFSLRIDQSKLELTCQPDVNVVAGLHWESGGFVINVSPGAREVSFFGSVGGLTVGLKHGFLSEDCVKLDARNLAFSVSFRKMELGPGDAVNSISVVLDTEFLGAVRFSRLQDILCFKAVWLDRIPILNKQSPIETKTPFTSTYTSSMDTSPKLDTPPDRGLSTMILVRIRSVKLEVDLGQSITKINLELHNSIFRTKLTDDLNEVFLFVGEVSLRAQGNISGHARVSSCVFQTLRRSEDALWKDSTRSKMLELRLTSNALVVSLDSDHQQLLHYRAEPLEVEISDDWSKIHTLTEDSRPLQLSFTVTCPEIVAAATVGTIPKLLSYMNKFKANLDAQRQGAFRESQTFRATRTPKPDNPLSAVAEAMLQSARSRFKEADSGLSYTVRQHMSLRLDLLRLIVFPRSMRDLEIAQFIGRDVQARLDGLVGSDTTPARRDLHLSFSSMIISKYTQVGHQPFVSVNSIEGQAGPDWPTALFKDATEATIVGLPSMKMHMISEESREEFTTTLTYDFHSEFVCRAGMKAFEDIYITLNMSLYSWLTVLRKNLTREMEQVRATEDWRTSMSAVSTTIVTGGSQRKKKVPEPLSLTDGPRSATLPTAGTAALSPFAPSSARYGWMDPTRVPQSAREHSSSPLAQTSSPPVQFPPAKEASEETPPISQGPAKRSTMIYKVRNRHIERLTMRQLGEATPDVMHPFFMKKAGFNLEDSLPQYVHEYATTPLEEIMEVLLKLYSQQLLKGTKKTENVGQ